MKTILCILCLALGMAISQAQVVYSGGSYTQDFNTLSSTGTSNAWTDNSTLTGWYANQTTYTTNPGTLGSTIGVGVFNRLTSMGTGSERALGSYLGALSLGAPVTQGLRIENNMGGTMTQFTLSFDIESYIAGLGGIVAADVLDAFTLSYSTTASDISGPGAIGYQLISSDPNLASINLVGSGTDTRRLEVTINSLNLANGSDLWIRWDRAALLGVTDNSLAIDNVGFSAVPEPGSVVLLLAGLGLLIGLRKKMRAVRSATLIAICCSLPLAQGLKAEVESGTISGKAKSKTETSGQAAEQEATAKLQKSPSEVGSEGISSPFASERSAEYKPDWSMMLVEDAFENQYGTEVESGEIMIADADHYRKSIRTYKVAVGDNPPKSLWIRHYSYLERTLVAKPDKLSNPDESEELLASTLAPIVRPDQLMPEWGSTELLGPNLNREEYSDRMFQMRGELFDTTERINSILSHWDTGNVTDSEINTLASTVRVTWLVRAHLVPDTRDIDDLLEQMSRRTNIRLNGEQFSPSKPSGT